MELLVKVEDVYAVLRSERPLGPTRDVALALLEEALREFSGTSPLLEQRIRALRTATRSVQGSLTSAVLDRDSDGWAEDIGRDEGPAIRASEVLHILGSSAPIGEMTRIAVQIIESAAKIGQGGHPGALAGTRELDAALARLRAVESGAGDNPTGAVAELRRLLEELLGVCAALSYSARKLASCQRSEASAGGSPNSDRRELNGCQSVWLLTMRPRYGSATSRMNSCGRSSGSQ